MHYKIEIYVLRVLRNIQLLNKTGDLGYFFFAPTNFLSAAL